MFNVRGAQYLNTMYIAAESQSSGNVQEVYPGEYLRVSDDNSIVLHTAGLLDCSALIVMSGWNGTHYEKRSIAHLLGGALSNGLRHKDCGSLLEELREDLKDGGTLILVSGENAQSNCGISITLAQKHAGQYPLLELMNDEKINSKIVGSNFVTVHPDGNIIYNDDSYCRGILSDEVKQSMMKDICEENNWQSVSHNRQKELVCAKKNDVLQKNSVRSLEHVASKNFELQEQSNAEAATCEIVRVPVPQSDSGPAIEALLNDYRLQIVQNSPLKALNAVTALVMVAVADPSAAASVICAENVRNTHAVSRLPELIAKGGIAPLAGAWIDLLHLLYTENHLSGQEVVQALLPNCGYDTSYSIAHALAGAAWNSEATTKMCALLSEVAGNDQVLHQEIVKRFSLVQPGYGFSRLKLDLPADFYKRAKRADSFSQNEMAKMQLKQKHLIPHKRELFLMARGIQAGRVSMASSFKALENKIKVEITPWVKESLAVMESEKASLERAKISARQRLDEFNTREREENKKRFDEMVSSFVDHNETQASLHSHSRQEKSAVYELLHTEKRMINQEKTPSWRGHVADTPASLFMPRVKVTGVTSHTEKTGGTTTDEEIAQRLALLKSFRAENETAQLEQRLADLRSFRNKYETAQLELRLKNLRRNSAAHSGGEKQLSARLKKD